MNSEKLESQLSLVCSLTDNYLEDKYGSFYPVHPNRMKRGQGYNPSFDGLFSTTIAFSLGYGSEFGRGYVFQIDIRTLEKVSSKVREEIEKDAFEFVEENLKKIIPDRNLSIVHDGKLMKIIGDFSIK